LPPVTPSCQFTPLHSFALIFGSNALWLVEFCYAKHLFLMGITYLRLLIYVSFFQERNYGVQQGPGVYFSGDQIKKNEFVGDCGT